MDMNAWVDWNGNSFVVLRDGRRRGAMPQTVSYSVSRERAVSAARRKGYSLPDEPIPMVECHNTTTGQVALEPLFDKP